MVKYFEEELTTTPRLVASFSRSFLKSCHKRNVSQLIIMIMIITMTIRITTTTTTITITIVDGEEDEMEMAS